MISIIACISRNRAIGYQNQLLYHIKSDMARFKELTMGHTIIMGRKTFESLPHGALPHRENIVVSRTMQEIPGCKVYSSLNDAFTWGNPNPLFCNTKEESWMASSQECFVIGGESIYRQALPLAAKLYLTIVDDEPVLADSFFPEIDFTEWEEERPLEWEEGKSLECETEKAEKEMRNENGLSFSFLTYHRKL